METIQGVSSSVSTQYLHIPADAEILVVGVVDGVPQVSYHQNSPSSCESRVIRITRLVEQPTDPAFLQHCVGFVRENTEFVYFHEMTPEIDDLHERLKTLVKWPDRQRKKYGLVEEEIDIEYMGQYWSGYAAAVTDAERAIDNALHPSYFPSSTTQPEE